jgi:hypothetical protein
MVYELMTRGIVKVKRSQGKTLWNGLPMYRLQHRQLCVRKDEAEERHEPVQLSQPSLRDLIDLLEVS